MSNTTRITIPVTITIDVAHGTDPMIALDDILVAAYRGASREYGTAHVTRIWFDADLADAKQTNL